MKVEYQSHELIEPEDMHGKPPDFPCVIIRVWYTRPEKPGHRGYIEWPLSLAAVNCFKAEARDKYIRGEIEVAIQAGREILERKG
ncbi:MAG: hypothetical protein KAR06_01295 [Deltaproteobacteria bacterium]|nr:hypothetical protein [Deltaproteobacteria bacterium]